MHKKEDEALALSEVLQGEITLWQQARRRYDGQLQETQVVLDNSERAIERIDHPRVSFIPTLRYGKPDAVLANWTLLMPTMAQQLVDDLDRQHPAFAPHRSQHIRELIQDRIAAAERGLRLLVERFPAPEEGEDDALEGPRP